MANVIHWFRQDLRIKWNPSLLHASKIGSLLPIYIWDTTQQTNYTIGKNSAAWVAYSLQKLNEQLQGNLLILSGDPAKLLLQLVKKHKVHSVYWNRCYEPWQITRDEKIKITLQNQGIQVKSFQSALLHEPSQVLNQSGTPYKVFSAFHRKLMTLLPHHLSPPANPCISFFKNSCSNQTDLSHLSNAPVKKEAGEEKALHKAQHFITHRLHLYAKKRNDPSSGASSQLSPHLHFGEISPLQLLHLLHVHKNDEEGVHAFKMELIWREFAYYLLYHFPELPDQPLKPIFKDFPWKKNASHLLQAWQQGESGIPIVDAGMRELLTTGFMHNRIRMITASFLIKHLQIDWRLGAKWFWEYLFDADLASNSMNWQWVAGCGVDAAPYFRIFNPITQAKKFDPKGLYIKKYLPVLSKLNPPSLFAPWEADTKELEQAHVKLGMNYPYPIVNLAEKRKESLAAYEKARKKIN